MNEPKTIKINDTEYVPKDEQKMAVNTEGLVYAIIRTYSAGCFAGYIKERNGKEGTILNARRLWYWSGAASLSELATEGVKKPNECKFPCEVLELILTEIIEVIHATEKAKKSIDNVKIWAA
jgi:hypothetical protein